MAKIFMEKEQMKAEAKTEEDEEENNMRLLLEQKSRLI